MKKKHGFWGKALCFFAFTAIVGAVIYGCGKEKEESNDGGDDKKTEEVKNPNDEVTGLKAYYPLDEIK